VKRLIWILLKTGCTLLFVLVFFFGCATVPFVRKEPAIEKAPPEVLRVPEVPVTEKDPFEKFPEKYRLKAMEFERRGELGKALFSWQIVHRFKPGDRESAERIESLEMRIRLEADKHFLQGLEHLKKNSIQETRREFLLALTYNRDHDQALDYLRYKLTDPDSIQYKTKDGDTLKRIAKEIYHDSEKDFVIAYFNDLNSNDRLKPGTALKIPNIESALAAKPAYPEEMLNKAKASLNAGSYNRAAYFAERVLEYAPTNGEANELKNASYYQLGSGLLQKKEYRESLRAFKKVDMTYKNVKETISDLEKRLRDQQAEAEKLYLEGVKHFVAQDLDTAVKEWERTLQLDPEHPKAKKDLEKARRMRENLKKVQ
jgi:tetratricopeptide (TPR) repeat protein